MAESVYDFSATTIRGEEKPLTDYRGKALLIVNTASKCGFTPQLEGLEGLHQKYAERGLVVLGFPCNQFLYQEPGDNSDILTFCQRNYGVSFPVFAKIEVNGKNTHPLFDYLKSNARGFWRTRRIKWNFTKFLVNGQGKVLKRYSPTTPPKQIDKDIFELILAAHKERNKSSLGA